MEQILALIGEKLNYTQELLMVALILGRTMPMIMLTPLSTWAMCSLTKKS